MTENADESGTRKAATADAFGERADRYRTSTIHSEGEDLDTLASWCAGATRALDIATGAGHTARALVNRGVGAVIAMDAAGDMVATAVGSVPGVQGVVGDAEGLPIASTSVDAVTCRIAAHHFPSPEAFVSEVYRVLRPGGVFAFEDNVAPEDPDCAAVLDRLERLHDPSHVASHPAATWRGWLADAGFDVEATIDYRKTVAFEHWMATRAAGAADPSLIRRTFLEAAPAVQSCLDVQTAGDEVVSFASPKALIRAVRPD